jgi:hypothetical protein
MFRIADLGVTLSYATAGAEESRIRSDQSRAVVNALIKKADRTAIIEAARRAFPSGTDPFEKDGIIWVGYIGIKFEADGHLAEMVYEAQN